MYCGNENIAKSVVMCRQTGNNVGNTRVTIDLYHIMHNSLLTALDISRETGQHFLHLPDQLPLVLQPFLQQQQSRIKVC